MIARAAQLGSRSRIHELAGVHHYDWDNSLEPGLRIESGDIVVLKCEEVCGGQVTPDATLDFLKHKLDFHRVACLTGPIAVAGAEPGDVLEVEILDFEHEGWAWTCVYPGFGLLAEDFGDTYGLHIWNVGADGKAELKPNIRVPVEPFLGQMGVALEAPGVHPSLPPRRVGGNMDTRQLVKGSTLYLPVEVPGALFSAGDGHLAQGDGEVTGTALEAPMTVTLRLRVLKGRSIPRPQFVTRGPVTSQVDRMGYYATSAAGTDLAEDVRNAVRDMIDHLEAEHGLTRVEAYILCSAAGDLKIAVPVLGTGHAGLVTFHMPRSIFVD